MSSRHMCGAESTWMSANETGIEISAESRGYHDGLAIWRDQAKPVYEELPGWRTDLSAATAPDDMPAAARNYVAFLSEQIGVPVRLVGVGPGREQTVSFATA